MSERSAFLFVLFAWYLRWKFRQNFHALRVSLSGLPNVPAGKKLIIYSNHPSWWDPALFIVVARKLLPTRRSFGPMDARQLTRYGLLRRMGVFGIDTGSPRGAAQFLQIGRRILADPRCALWVTAEGRFVDPRQRPVELRPGIAHLARHDPDVVFLPLAIEYPFWDESRPEALLRFGQPVEIKPNLDIAEVTLTLSAALTETMDVLARESMSRNAGLFRPLVQGTVGVGGIYDLWRRAWSWAQGRAFNPAHSHEPAKGRMSGQP